MLNQIRTVFFLSLLTGIMLGLGAIWGRSGLIIAAVFALAFNFVSYWFSDKIVLKLYRAKEAKVSQYPRLYQIVNELVKKAKMPLPKVYIIPTDNPNAFATGRNPKHAAVAVTTGIMSLLNEKELRGVLAHELSHVKNRDILVSTIAATIAGAIAFVASMARWSAILGGGRDRNNLLQLLAIGIITPIIATLIHLAVSRSREYLADESGAKLLKDGSGLASALQKLEQASKTRPMRFGSQASAHLFIVNPFKGLKVSSLMSTHPQTADRVKKLEKLTF